MKLSIFFIDVQDRPEPYNFAFDVKDEYGNTLIRQEQGDEAGNKRGTYGYVDAYGISRQVDYVADDKGFRAVVKTNEPGTDNQNPADVEIISSAAPASYVSKAAPAYVGPAIAPVYGQPGPVYGAAPVNQLPLRQVVSPSYRSAQPVAPLY